MSSSPSSISGCGISCEMLDKVLEPFFTTKDVGKGTGLGLSMVYGFAKQSGGTLHIDSQVGEGTRAELWLPRATTGAASAGARGADKHTCGAAIVADSAD